MEPQITHPAPGAVLQLAYLEPNGVSLETFAEAAGFSLAEVVNIVEDGGAVTPEAARRISAYLGTSEAFWLEMQRRYDARATLQDDEELRALIKEGLTSGEPVSVSLDELLAYARAQHAKRG